MILNLLVIQIFNPLSTPTKSSEMRVIIVDSTITVFSRELTQFRKFNIFILVLVLTEVDKIFI